MKSLSFILFVSIVSVTAVQAQDTIYLKATRLSDFNVYKDRNAYKRELERIRKIYPYALHAAEMLDKFDAELGLINTKRKKRKYSKQAHSELKGDFNYVVRDLYRSEGELLMKLIYRETGLTAAEIIKKYRGKLNSQMYDQLGKIWDQDLDIKYDPEGKDKLTEKIILEIESELVEFVPEAKMVTKDEYKQNMKEYREDKKEYRILKRQKKKLERIERRSGSDDDKEKNGK